MVLEHHKLLIFLGICGLNMCMIIKSDLSRRSSKGFSYLSLEGYSVMKWLHNIMKDLNPDFTRDDFNNKIKTFIANNAERKEMPKPNIVFLGSSPWRPGIN